MQTQEQLLWQEHGRISAMNTAFMNMIRDPKNPMTDSDLAALIQKRPHVYGRFSGFLGTLDTGIKMRRV